MGGERGPGDRAPSVDLGEIDRMRMPRGAVKTAPRMQIDEPAPDMREWPRFPFRRLLLGQRAVARREALCRRLIGAGERLANFRAGEL